MFKVELGSDDFCNDSGYVKIGNVVKAIAGILLSNGSPNRFQAERNAWPYIHTGIEAGKLHPLAPETLDVLSIDHYENGVVSFSELVEWGLWSHRFDFVTAGFEAKTKTPALVGADEIDSSMVATRQQLTGLHEGRVMNYEPLAKLIEPYADGPFDKLPDGLRERVKEAFPVHWNGLTPDQRYSLARQHDDQNDPAMEPENRYWHNLGSEIWATELKMTEWEKKDRRIPSEALIWEVQRAALDDRLNMLKGLWKLPPFLVADWETLTDAALAEVVADAPVQSPATPAPVLAETKEQRQDRRLQACIDADLPMNTKAALSRLPDGVGNVAGSEGVTRQTFSTDIKAALERRESAKREGVTMHRA